MLILGLTGSAAMGKSTVSAMLAELGAAVFDADRAVHALYQGRAAPLIEAAFPGTTRDGAVDRAALRARVFGDAAALARLEAIVHPLVREAEAAARDAAMRTGRRFLVLDVPLLLETGREGDVDAVVVVSAPKAVQEARLLARPGIDAAAVEAIRARQMDDAGKRRRAHVVIDTGGTLDAPRRQAADLLRAFAGAAAG
ncbi:MAG TPA: dephospho-CoA kinase [Bauldia sp.]|nr:dephospho-CoA kinase [Bauldia sp.]